jgi:Zn finger protein HypA/HybF involved in hydrogenase expression
MPSTGDIAADLLQHLESQLPGDGFHLQGIEVKVGELLDLDRDALRAMLCAMLPGVEVRITTVPGLLRCKDCGAEYPGDEHPCPACGSPHAELVQGGELEIARAWGTR